jgi:hypothetical protein
MIRAGEIESLMKGSLHTDELIAAVVPSATGLRTRHSIGRILLYEYERLERALGHRPSRKEVDRNCILGSSFYADVFRSWPNFEQLYGSQRARAANANVDN